MSATLLMDDAVAQATAIRDGTTSAAALLEATLDAIAARDPVLNCYTDLRVDAARGEAAAIDAALARGEDPGPLTGVPVAVKNLFDIAGLPTRAGSKVLGALGLPPPTRDATALARLRGAGAVLVGALNMDEFAYGFSTENAHVGPTRNPADPQRIAGGSSGGSAAAVAAGLAAITLGSDTNGSIRVPASLCGIWGLKPTYGRLSRAGAWPFVASFDHVGPFARSVRDLALAYELMQGGDPRDPACTGRVDPVGDLDAQAPGLRIGVLGGWFADRADGQAGAAVERAAAMLAEGGTRHDVTLPMAEAARSAAFCITGAEGGALHLPILRTHADLYDPAVRDRLLAGTMLPASVVHHAQRVRRAFAAQVSAVFEEFDLLLAPATPVSAPPIGDATIILDGVEVSARANLGLYAQPISFVGLPVIAAPVPGAALPLGVQLIAPPWAEARLFAAARRLERAFQ
ncbi:AtzE family amidohydrolase [Endobacter medicaginis]|uniref:AtzE family amidohydrolase n=2 Tax=Endobacter medicaginis TaxID=1181271 RepID=A0A839UYM1_9PROT|nr:AtzE family amidohydrolase [Endobacter medicaginis]MBB3173453.1 AtzE family amidohydrolase [Endobacter medicaginis]MCX5475512.1 AtzE family amidohydrolase [Endobacter medicaginis]